MEALLTWRYFLIPEDKFNQIKPKADELDGLRNRELNDEENQRKESLIDEINSLGESIAHRVLVFKDDENSKDGTIIEELVFRMDEAPEVRGYAGDFYFPFLVYSPPEVLKSQYPTIEKVFSIISDHDLLKKEFLGKWEYLTRAREIFIDLRAMFREAFDNNCGIIKTDKLEWLTTEEDTEETDVEMDIKIRPADAYLL